MTVITLNFLLFLLCFVALLFLQNFICKKSRKRILCLLLPLLSLLFSIGCMMSSLVAFTLFSPTDGVSSSSQVIEHLPISVSDNWLQIIWIFFLLNIPTLLFTGIYIFWRKNKCHT